MTPHEGREEQFQGRLRQGVPMMRAAACRVWSEVRCACELEDLVAAGSKVLVEAARQAASDAEFLDRMENDLRPALREVARAVLGSETRGAG